MCKGCVYGLCLRCFVFCLWLDSAACCCMHTAFISCPALRFCKISDNMNCIVQLFAKVQHHKWLALSVAL